MKTFAILTIRHAVLAAAAFTLITPAAPAALPQIQSVQAGATNILVTASFGAGHAAIYLERRDRFGSGAWTPVGVQRVASAAGTITFNLPRDTEFGFLRVRADNSLPLPASFYTGTNVSDLELTPSAGMFGLDSTGGAPTSGQNTRPVVESDIWRLDGDTLYFFNQSRGLQVIDVSDPDNAELQGVLNLPASGEQMYVLSSNHVVLLAQTSCGSDSSPFYFNGYSTGSSAVLIVNVSNGVPQIVAELPLEGRITESRLVGTGLYVASQVLRATPEEGGDVWEWATQIASFDLSHPAAPVLCSTNWHSGYNNVVYATDTFLFAAVANPTNSYRSILRAIDITSPDGAMHPHSVIHIAGRVADKFKLNWHEGILSVISEVQSNPRRTKLETFSLPAPTGVPITPEKLGEVEVGHGERLFATRFDGERAYIVTFRQIDPLWVVDLRDPENPSVSGELEIPGWSTYIHPMGGKLLAVGVETNVTTVSLFDVADPGAPALLSRVALGSQYSYSEANSDEKAFNVLEDLGLILLPVQSYASTPNAWVQLVDFTTNSLAVRGSIEHSFVPRRATVHRDRIVSVSPVELLTVDAADRDRPLLTGALTLSWPVSRVFMHGDHLLQISGGSPWDSGQDARVIVTSRANPAARLNSLLLTNGYIAGSEVAGNRLYVAQVLGAPVAVSTNQSWSNTIHLTVISLDDLPQLTITGRASGPMSDFLNLWNGQMQAVWPQTNLLVWAGGQNIWAAWDVVTVAPTIGFGFWPFPSRGGGRLVAFDVSDDRLPALRSEVNLATNAWWGFSKAFAAEGLVYFSHNVFYQPGTNAPFPGWAEYHRSFLDVVDYADPASPTARQPLPIRGELKGISDKGALLYTLGYSARSTNYYDWFEAVYASAYDGVQAHLVDSIPLTNNAIHPLVVQGGAVFLAGRDRLSVSNLIFQQLEAWTLNTSGQFTMLGSAPLLGYVFDLVSFPGLVAAQTGWAQVEVFDSTTPVLRSVGIGPDIGCLSFDLSLGDAKPGEDLWLPLGFYGVARVPLKP